MPRRKRKSAQTLARRKAAQRRQETPEQRAARLKSSRDYARHRREHETTSQREERLKSMRYYVRNARKQEIAKLRQQRLAKLLGHIKDVEKNLDVHELDSPPISESHYVFIKQEKLD